MFELNMDGKSKGIAWVGNVYQKFEAMCLEMDDTVCQETFQYVEDQLQTAGANVKQFCTELIQEVLPSSPTNSKEELNSPLVQNADVANEDSNACVDKERIKKELIHASSVEYVDTHLGLSSEHHTENECAMAQACKNEAQEIDSTLDDTLLETKELIHASSVEYVDTHLGLSSEHHTENECALAQACKNEAQEIDSTLDDTLLETKEEACYKYVPKLELEAVPVPSFNKLKLEESCIIIDSSELGSLSNELRERRSLKKKFRKAFSSKWMLPKPYNEQHPGCSKEKGNSLELFSDTTKSKSLEMGFSESDWEIL